VLPLAMGHGEGSGSEVPRIAKQTPTMAIHAALSDGRPERGAAIGRFMGPRPGFCKQYIKQYVPLSLVEKERQS
jgi:hypothetical protein